MLGMLFPSSLRESHLHRSLAVQVSSLTARVPAPRPSREFPWPCANPPTNPGMPPQRFAPLVSDDLPQSHRFLSDLMSFRTVPNPYPAFCRLHRPLGWFWVSLSMGFSVVWNGSGSSSHQVCSVIEGWLAAVSMPLRSYPFVPALVPPSVLLVLLASLSLSSPRSLAQLIPLSPVRLHCSNLAALSSALSSVRNPSFESVLPLVRHLAGPSP